MTNETPTIENRAVWSVLRRIDLQTKRAAAIGNFERSAMDKKVKKKIEILRVRSQKLKQQLSGAKQQDDEPGEVERLEGEIAAAEAELEKLKAS